MFLKVLVKSGVVVVAEMLAYLTGLFPLLQKLLGKQHLFLHDIAFNTDLHVLVKDVLNMGFR